MKDKDKNKTKEQLIKELESLRQQVAELEQLEFERGRSEMVVQEAHTQAEAMIETMREPQVVLDTHLRVISVSHSFYRTFKVTPEDTQGKLIYDLGNRQWNISKLRVLLEKILPRKDQLQDFEVHHEFPTIGRKIMLLNARQIYNKGIGAQMILLAIEDITERKKAEEEIKKLNKGWQGQVKTNRR